MLWCKNDCVEILWYLVSVFVFSKCMLCLDGRLKISLKFFFNVIWLVYIKYKCYIFLLVVWLCYEFEIFSMDGFCKNFSK